MAHSPFLFQHLAPVFDAAAVTSTASDDDVLAQAQKLAESVREGTRSIPMNAALPIDTVRMLQLALQLAQFSLTAIRAAHPSIVDSEEIEALEEAMADLDEAVDDHLVALKVPGLLREAHRLMGATG